MGTPNQVTGGIGGVMVGSGARSLPGLPGNIIGTPPGQTPGMSFDAWLQQMLTRYQKTNFTAITLSLTNGYSQYLVPQRGTNLRYAYASGVAAGSLPPWVFVNLDTPQNGQIPLNQGNDILRTAFDQFYITAAPVAGINVVLLAWTDEPGNPVILR